jgi:hypothetical protein
VQLTQVASQLNVLMWGVADVSSTGSSSHDGAVSSIMRKAVPTRRAHQRCRL